MTPALIIHKRMPSVRHKIKRVFYMRLAIDSYITIFFNCHSDLVPYSSTPSQLTACIEDTIRWRMISAVFAVPVTGYLIIQMMKPHEHMEPPPEYPYLKMATRVSYQYALCLLFYNFLRSSRISIHRHVSDSLGLNDVLFYFFLFCNLVPSLSLG